MAGRFLARCHNHGEGICPKPLSVLDVDIKVFGDIVHFIPLFCHSVRPLVYVYIRFVSIGLLKYGQLNPSPRLRKESAFAVITNNLEIC